METAIPEELTGRIYLSFENQKRIEHDLVVAVAVEMCVNPELLLRRVVHISISPHTSLTPLFNPNRIP